MPIYSGYVTEGTSDWDDASAVATTLAIIRTNDGSGNPSLLQLGYALLNTSGITTGGTPTITDATFYWKHTTADNAKPMDVSIWNGSSWTSIYAGFGGATTWKSTGITDETRLGYINASGGTKTALKFTCTQSAASVSRTIRVQSYEGSPTGTPYVVLSYTYPSSAKKKRIYIIS